jgi:GTPase
MSNIVAIVGRPNVGKSTLFNRLTGSKSAIIDPTSGVTRDRHYGKSSWNGKEFSIIDTGGYMIGGEDVFEEEICKQVEIAIEEADAILFLVDAKEGLTSMDEDVAEILRKSNKTTLLVANKVDSFQKSMTVSEFYSLGLGEIYEISAANGSGTGELLDALVKDFKDKETFDNEEDALPHIAVVGRPNVGKSSFINVITNQDRNIVKDVAGTTRDSINTRYNLFGFDFIIVDTAGLRKKTAVKENIEFYSVMRAIRSLEMSDVCVLIVDASVGFDTQDLNILSLCERNNKGVVICVNKWDKIEKNTNTMKEFEQNIRNKIQPFTDVPIIFTSVINKQRIFKVLEQVRAVYENRNKKIPTSRLNEDILPIVKELNPPPLYKGKRVKIKYITQLKTPYPQFVFYCNLPQYVKQDYIRFCENKLREKYDFCGVPMTIYFREK